MSFLPTSMHLLSFLISVVHPGNLSCGFLGLVVIFLLVSNYSNGYFCMEISTGKSNYAIFFTSGLRLWGHSDPPSARLDSAIKHSGCITNRWYFQKNSYEIFFLL